jgi:hypothetical protein
MSVSRVSNGGKVKDLNPRVVDSPYFEQKLFLVMFYIATVP